MCSLVVAEKTALRMGDFVLILPPLSKHFSVRSRVNTVNLNTHGMKTEDTPTSRNNEHF